MRAPPPEVQVSSSRVRTGRAGMGQLLVMLRTWRGWMTSRRKIRKILPQLGTPSLRYLLSLKW